MRLLNMLAFILALAAPAAAQSSAYDSLTLSTTTGRARRATSGFVVVAKSSQTPTTYTIQLEGPSGSIKGSSATLTYGVTAATGNFTATGDTTYSVVLSSGINMLAGGIYTAFVKATTFFGNLVGNVTGNVTGNATTATALAANGANCSAASFPLGVDASGAVESCTALSASNAGTATALAANGANCSSGNYPLGVDASGAAEGCTPAGAGDAVLNSTQTFSGFNTFAGSTTLTGFVSHLKSTHTYVPNGSTSQATFIVAYASATRTDWSGRYDVECIANVGYSNNGAGLSHIAFMLDGGFVSPGASNAGQVTEYDPGGRISNTPFFRFPKESVTAGSHTFAISFAATIAGSTVWPAATGMTHRPFFRCAEVY